MWRERVSGLTKSAVFKSPADESILEEVETVLKVNLPEELHDLLSESNGIEGEYGLSLIWNCERIIADNLRFRNHADFPDLYMSFEQLLFFC